MNWILIAMQLLAKLPALMMVAEKAFDDIPDSGAEKKEMVMTAAKAIAGGILGISTGGQAETWARIEKIINPAIDIMCTFLFPNSEEAGQEVSG